MRPWWASAIRTRGSNDQTTARPIRHPRDGMVEALFGLVGVFFLAAYIVERAHEGSRRGKAGRAK